MVDNPQSPNGYPYVVNDPVNLVDPFGLYWMCHAHLQLVQVAWADDGGVDEYIAIVVDSCEWVSLTPAPGDGGGGDEQKAANNAPDPNAQDPTKLPLCVEVFAKETLNNLNPFTPSASTFVPAATDVAARVQYNNIIKYALSRPNFMGGTGLLYPMKSSVVRGMLQSVQTTLKATPWAMLVAAEAQALFTELDMARKGQCRAY